MITVFLPCRAGSERVPNKNTKPFGGVQGGLLTIKLNQLLKAKLVDRIVVSTNDSKVIEIARRTSNKIIIDLRPEKLATSSTSTDDLICYVPEIINEGHVVWTHTTSPFLNEENYDKAISVYLNKIKNKDNDSLMTVNSLRTFLWNEQGSYNYDSSVEKWPRTQTLPNLLEVNSGIFINSVDNYKKYRDRIGLKPYMMQTEGYASFDIDWPEDFDLGELIYEKLNKRK